MQDQGIGTYYLKELIYEMCHLFTMLYKPCHECCLRNVKGIVFSLKYLRALCIYNHFIAEVQTQGNLFQPMVELYVLVSHQLL